MDILATYQAKYTVELRALLNDPIIRPKIDKALSTYPLYQKKSEEKYIPSIVPTREELNKKILDYYKYREIGFETVGRFIDELEIAMHEIMPYYNQLFFSADQDYDILYNVDYIKEIETIGSGSSTSEGVNSGQSSDSTTTNATVNRYNKNVKSGTPQESLDIKNTGIDSVNYADELGFTHDTNTDNGSSKGSSSSNSTSSMEGTSESSSRTVEKTNGNYGAMSTQRQVQEYRDIIINIEQELINDPRIQELFMLIY